MRAYNIKKPPQETAGVQRQVWLECKTCHPIGRESNYLSQTGGSPEVCSSALLYLML